MILKRHLSPKDNLSPKDMLSGTGATADAIVPATLDFSEQKKARKAKSRWPNFAALDLRNHNDIFTCWQLLVGSGLAEDSHDGLYRVVLAALLTTRLAKGNVSGYFAQTLKRGFRHPVTDADHARAKSIIRQLDY